MLGPFMLDPVLSERPWGGNRLAGLGRAVPPGVVVGESWEIADLPAEAVPGATGARSLVSGGEHDGRSLHDLIERYGPELLGSAHPTDDGDFPLLVKLLDAGDDLSVQVHPHAGYVAAHPDARLKTESWYVVDAEPGAVLYLDLADALGPDDVAPDLGTARFVEHLRTVPAVPGGFHHLPAGLVHALGAGTLVAEIQTPSDTTFRIYDWSDDSDREQRELHLRQAAATMVARPVGWRSLEPEPDVERRTLETNDHYRIVEHRTGGEPLPPGIRDELRIVWPVRGGVVVGGVEADRARPVVVPAVSWREEVRPTEDAVVLDVALV